MTQSRSKADASMSAATKGAYAHSLPRTQPYISCDPFLNVFDGLDKQPNLIRAYPFLRGPVNFVCCEAEFLPFTSRSFDTVHMRSVIDHFLNPEIALAEAYRVLDAGGALIVGLYVHGGKTGKQRLWPACKEFIRESLSAVGIDRYKDSHVWHPTYVELARLIEASGFSIDVVHWQKWTDDNVCYIRARKQRVLRLQSVVATSREHLSNELATSGEKAD